MQRFALDGKNTGRLSRFTDRMEGTISIMTALLMPLLVMLSLGGVGVTKALSERQRAASIAETACNRSLKPTRMKIYEDGDRQARAEAMFDKMMAEAGIRVHSRKVTATWLRTDVEAVVKIPLLSFIGKDSPDLTVKIEKACEGVPPYPAVGDVILSSAFKKPDGVDLPMKYGHWGVYKAEEFGWDSGFGPGIEIQDWHIYPGFGKLPPGSKSPYVVELDSHNGPASNPGNSSMSRILELHRGTYEFSFWYYGRQDDVETNRISVYLEGVRPVGPKVQKISIAEPKSKGWIKATFEVRISGYSIYRLEIAAEGNDDTLGGNFNDLRLTYKIKAENK